MNKRILKRLSMFLFWILVALLALMITPRTISSLRRSKPPIGYFHRITTYLAVKTGLEKLVDLNPAVPDNINLIKDIEYRNTDGKSLQVDILKPEVTATRPPLLIFIHGGSWRSGKRSDYMVYMVDFARRGYVTATVSYRLLKDGLYPAAEEDIAAAVKWFFMNGDNYGYDTSRIALIGGSAGAHLAMLEAYKRNSGHRVKAVVDIYGPSDLTTEYARNHRLVRDFIGKGFEEAPGIYLTASPAYYIDRSDPPTLILHGTSDELVPVSQSASLKEKLDSAGVAAVLVRFPGWPHTMDLARRVNSHCQEEMERFFNKYLN